MGCTSSKNISSSKFSKDGKENVLSQPIPGFNNEEEYSEKVVKTTASLQKTSSKSNLNDNVECQLLEGAPKSFNTFVKVNFSKFKTPRDANSIVIDENSIRKTTSSNISSSSNPQPVDHFARQLAISNKRPATWKDFYWHLIESRGLKTDEDKCRAIFSWVCSLNSFDKPSDPDVNVQKLSNKPPYDSPIALVESFRLNKINHNQAFEILCTACNLQCCTIQGITKGANFDINDRELLNSIEETGQPLYNEQEDQVHPLAMRHVHAWNACKIDEKWELFDPTWAAKRLTIKKDNNNEPKVAEQNSLKEAIILQYETDMFYFKTDPKRLFYTHFPFDPKWQLIDPQISLNKFYETVLLKPLFFSYGLEVYSHTEASILTKSELVIKLRLPENAQSDLKFTFNLTREGLGEIHKSQNLFPFGMHWISEKDRVVTFRFRLPKSGKYRLNLYARKKDEKLFADICEYSILAKVSNPESVYPFPHDSQTSYGPTETAKEVDIMVTPSRTDAILKSINGIIELKFRNATNGNLDLPKITARLKSVLDKTEGLQDCLLFRNIEACRATTGMSDYLQVNPKNPIFGCGSCVPLSVVTAYLPKPGEYALEVFAKAANSPEEDSYRLVWQFMINSELSWPMTDHLRAQLTCINMGPQNHLWEKLGLSSFSHVDPLIRIPTHGRIKDPLNDVSRKSQKNLIPRYASEASTINSSNFGPESSTASQITVMDVNQLEAIKSDQVSGSTLKNHLENIDEGFTKDSYDLKIVITGPPRDVVTVIAQLVDISEDDERDVTPFLRRLSDEESNTDEDLLDDLIQHELSPAEKSQRNSGVPNSYRIAYHIRIPTGGHFYKLYLYASPTSMEITESIPLVFTYLIEAPSRLTSSEQPYVGVILGPYEKQKEAQ